MKYLFANTNFSSVAVGPHRFIGEVRRQVIRAGALDLKQKSRMVWVHIYIGDFATTRADHRYCAAPVFRLKICHALSLCPLDSGRHFFAMSRSECVVTDSDITQFSNSVRWAEKVDLVVMAVNGAADPE